MDVDKDSNMAIGYFLRVGDKTTCGGQILTGDNTMQWYGVAGAREGDLVTCGKHSGKYYILGGVSSVWLADRKHAGTLDSFSSCPCKAQFIHSINDCYSKEEQPSPRMASAPIQQPEQSFAQPSSSQPSAMPLINECTISDNLLFDGVFAWTETAGSGHSFITIHENNNVSLYSYGRYGRTGPATLTGDGILLYMTGDDAREYIRNELYIVNARVFKISDADIHKTKTYFNNLWSSGVTPLLPSEAGDLTRRNGKTIDVYDVSGNNCTTHTVKGLKQSGSEIFKDSYTPARTQFPIEREDSFTVPVSFQNFLESKKHNFEKLDVIEVTDEFKKQYPNYENLTSLDKGTKQQIFELVTFFASMAGIATSIDGGETGGILGSSYEP